MLREKFIALSAVIFLKNNDINILMLLMMILIFLNQWSNLLY